MTSEPRFNSPRRFTVVSSCPELWGGSEELWSRAACVLAERGARFLLLKDGVGQGASQSSTAEIFILRGAESLAAPAPTVSGPTFSPALAGDTSDGSPPGFGCDITGRQLRRAALRLPLPKTQDTLLADKPESRRPFLATGQVSPVLARRVRRCNTVLFLF
jgi:hypothetical protein